MKNHIVRSLLAIISSFNPKNDFNVQTPLPILVDKVRCSIKIPLGLRQMLEKAESDDPTSNQMLNFDLKLWNEWLVKNSFDNLPQINEAITNSTAPSSHSSNHLSGNGKSEKSEYQAPETWQELCNDIRNRMQESLSPFENYDLPQRAWESLWVEAFNVISTNGSNNTASTILIPSKDACESDAAELFWKQKVIAAQKIHGLNHRLQCGRVANVIQTPPIQSAGYLVLERGNRTLDERLKTGNSPDLHETIELGLALCELLESLYATGVSILDIPFSTLVFESSPGLRITQLLEPTAILPNQTLIPEWRDCTVNEVIEAEEDCIVKSQIFLVAAIILGIAQNTFQELVAKNIPKGRSASLARLSGQHHLADADPDRIIEPLIEDLDKKWYRNRHSVNFKKIAQVFRWALSEQPAQRFPSLKSFSNDLSGCLVK